MAIDMALTKRNPITGKFGIAWNGNEWATDDTEEWAVLSRLIEKRGKYHQDKDGTYGSHIKEVRSLTGATPSQLEGYAREALQPLVDDKRIILLETPPPITVNMQKFINRVRLGVTWTRPKGGPPRSNFVLL